MAKDKNIDIEELAKKAGSADELRKTAAKNGIKLSKKEAAEIFDKFDLSGELSDDDLEAAAGGFSTGCLASKAGGFLKQLG